MPEFSARSRRNLETCHPDLQELFNRVVEDFDCTITEGHRDEATQNFYFDAKPQVTKVKWPDSKHNKIPSMAVDVVPYPVDYKDRDRFHLFAGFVLGIASILGIRLRWGGDWNGDTEVADNTFDDLPHYELVG